MQNVPKIVQARLQRATVAPSEIHPDADLLTAFAEHALRGSEREQVMEHLVRCAECRDVVALALPASDTVALPGTSTGASTWFTLWLSWPAVRWGVVAAGIALVTSIGLLEYNHRTLQNAALTGAAGQRYEKATAASQRSQPAPDEHKEEIVAPVPRPAKQVPMPRPLRGKSVGSANQASPEVNTLVPSAPPMARRGAEGGGPATAQHESAEEQAARSQITRQDQGQQQLAQSQALGLLQTPSLNNLDVVKAKDSVAPQAELGSTPRWAISSTGALQRSFDGGTTWDDVNVTQTSASAARMESAAEFKKQAGATPSRSKEIRTQRQANPLVVFRAVTALGPEVWAAGNSAMLFHSFDSGAHWMRVVPLEANVSPTGDIFSVEFSDAQHGKIATSAGELWITSDDGQTWHKQQ